MTSATCGYDGKLYAFTHWKTYLNELSGSMMST